MGVYSFIISELVLTCIGVLLQLYNIHLGSMRLLRNNKSLFNAFMLISMALYAGSFVPLIVLTSVRLNAYVTTGQVLENNEAGLAQIYKNCSIGHNSLYALSTLIYVIQTQYRFNLILQSFSKHQTDIMRIAFTVTVAIVWVVLAFFFGVIWNCVHQTIDANTLSLQALVSWSVFCLLLDGTLSAIVLRKVYVMKRNRVRLKESDPYGELAFKLKFLKQKILAGLVLVCLTSIASLIIVALASLVADEGDEIRVLMYRTAYFFTPLQFTGAILFFGTLEELVTMKPARKVNRSAKQPLVAPKDNVEGEDGILPSPPLTCQEHSLQMHSYDSSVTEKMQDFDAIKMLFGASEVNQKYVKHQTADCSATTVVVYPQRTSIY